MRNFRNYLNTLGLNEANLSVTGLKGRNANVVFELISRIENGESIKLVDGRDVVFEPDEKVLDALSNNLSALSARKDSEKVLFRIKGTGEQVTLSKIQKTGEFNSVNITAADWEKAIVVAHNMVSLGLSKEKAISTGNVDWAPKLDEILYKGALKIAEYLKTKDSLPLYHYGSSSSKITKEWEQFFIDMTGKRASAASKTPKTDFYSSNNKYSLKKRGGSQLMSGGKAESLATLAFAFNKTPEHVKDDVFKTAFAELTDEISKSFNRYSNIGSITKIKKDIKAGKKSKLIDDINKQIKKNNEMKSALRDLTQTEEFKYAIVHEAMTGNDKFADPYSSADHLMVFDSIGNCDVQKIDSALISKVAAKTRFDISFKAASSNAWVAMKGIVNESEISFMQNDLLESTFLECFDDFINEHDLNEGILDKVKILGSKILTFVKNWVQKIINVLKSNFQSLINLCGIKLGADIVYEF